VPSSSDGSVVTPSLVHSLSIGVQLTDVVDPWLTLSVPQMYHEMTGEIVVRRASSARVKRAATKISAISKALDGVMAILQALTL